MGRDLKDAHGLKANISGLCEIDSVTLRARWQKLYGSEAPKRIGRDLLIRAIAYRMQEEAQGGPKPALRRRLKKMAKDLKTQGDRAITSQPRIKPGTRLLREWKGETHSVTALEEGFEFQGARYKSLSEIAREITGTRWSGPAFFGLKQSKRVVSTPCQSADDNRPAEAGHG